MLTRVTAIEHHSVITSGRTRPSRIVCERADGTIVEIVAKFSAGCEEKEASLAREVIAACLAGDLGSARASLAAKSTLGRSELHGRACRMPAVTEYERALPGEWTGVAGTVKTALSLIRDARDRIDACLAEVKRVLT
jgi:hypothetical protein